MRVVSLSCRNTENKSYQHAIHRPINAHVSESPETCQNNILPKEDSECLETHKTFSITYIQLLTFSSIKVLGLRSCCWVTYASRVHFICSAVLVEANSSNQHVMNVRHVRVGTWLDEPAHSTMEQMTRTIPTKCVGRLLGIR